MHRGQSNADVGELRKARESMQLKFDTPYSWIVLLGVIVCNFTSVGVLFGSAGVFSAEYPLLLNTEKKHTNIISSVTTGVFLFTGKCSYYSLVDQNPGNNLHPQFVFF